MLSEITGFTGISLQPNAGAQGEYAGLMVIRKYHLSRGDTHRNVCLIPQFSTWNKPCKCGHGRNEGRGREIVMKMETSTLNDLNVKNY